MVVNDLAYCFRWSAAATDDRSYLRWIFVYLLKSVEPLRSNKTVGSADGHALVARDGAA